MCLTTRSDVSDTVPETGLENPDQRSVGPVEQDRALHTSMRAVTSPAIAWP